MRKFIFVLCVGFLLFMNINASAYIAEFTKDVKECKVIRDNSSFSCKKGFSLLYTDKIKVTTLNVLDYIRVLDSNYTLKFTNGYLEFDKNNYISYFFQYKTHSFNASVRNQGESFYNKINKNIFINPKNSLAFQNQTLIFTCRKIYENPIIKIYDMDNKIVYKGEIKKDKKKSKYIKIIRLNNMFKPGYAYKWEIFDKDGLIKKGIFFIVQDSKSAKAFIDNVIKNVKDSNIIKVYSNAGYYWYVKKLVINKGGEE